PIKRAYIALKLLPVVSEHYDQRNFPRFRRLEIRNSKVEPAATSVLILSDPWNQNRHQGHYGQSEDHPDDLLQPTVINESCRHADDQPNRCRNALQQKKPAPARIHFAAI